ncbi:Clavaminate synthase-like protein, partial [Trametes coccinea BRFM310]
LLETRPVPAAAPALAASPPAFLSSIRSPDATPFLLRGGRAADGGSPRDALLRTLRGAGERLVEVEVGRYDRPAGFERVQVLLGVYLEWLTRSEGEREGEKVQLYLAQWRARDEIPGLEQLVKPPPLLAPLLESGAVDLYQTSFFIGPSTAVTPLHYDPYYNLYTVYASSDASTHAKHFVLFPPAASEHLSRADDGSVMRNTSPVDLHLRRSGGGDGFDVVLDPESASARVRDALLRGEGGALSCVVREGDTLFVPRRWWHRVENVALREGGAAWQGWTAGVGWWFLPRS